MTLQRREGRVEGEAARERSPGSARLAALLERRASRATSSSLFRAAHAERSAGGWEFRGMNTRVARAAASASSRASRAGRGPDLGYNGVEQNRETSLAPG